MKIAIFHNLPKGGGLNSIIELINSNEHDIIDVYSFNSLLRNQPINKTYRSFLPKTKNIFSHLLLIFIKLPVLHQKIASIINSNKYDLVLVFPCLLTQSPYILRYLDSNKTVYILNEPKREFYEPTSYDHHSLRRTIARIIRLPIKFIDIKNARYSKLIIANSFYTQNIIKKIYKKESTVIYPGLKLTPIKKISIKNNNKIITVGLLSRIKGHDFSIKQINGIHEELTIIGRLNEDFTYINKLSKDKNVKLNIINTENDLLKNRMLKRYSIYLANPQNEPFGISTLEACTNNCFILGKNEGGTPEIIRHGLNGLLYPNMQLGKRTLSKTLTSAELPIYKTSTTDWSQYLSKIKLIYKYHNNQPNE